MTTIVVDGGQPAASNITFTDTVAVPATTATEATPTAAAPVEPAATEQTASIPQIDLTQVRDPDMVQFYKDSAELGEVTLVGDSSATAKPVEPGAAEPAAPAKPAEPQPQDAAAKPAPMIPKARFDEVSTAAQRARDEAMYWRGVAEARSTAPAPAVQDQQAGQQVQTQQPLTFEQQIAALAAREDAISEQFDNGEIDAKTMNQQLRTLRQEEANLREANLQQQIAQTVPKAPTVDEVRAQLESEQHAQALYQAHPLAGLVFPEAGTAQAAAEAADPGLAQVMHARREMVKVEARTTLLAQYPGVSGPQADALFRQVLAQTADQYARVWFPNEAAKTAIKPAGTPALSPTAQARLDKMGVAAAQPPNPASLGTSQGVADQWTPEAYAALTDDQLARLPQHVHERFSH